MRVIEVKKHLIGAIDLSRSYEEKVISVDFSFYEKCWKEKWRRKFRQQRVIEQYLLAMGCDYMTILFLFMSRFDSSVEFKVTR